ncbi:MAG: hypothetical protein WCH43_14810 [Verrucomicrobiota bacterium]
MSGHTGKIQLNGNSGMVRFSNLLRSRKKQINFRLGDQVAIEMFDRLEAAKLNQSSQRLRGNWHHCFAAFENYLSDTEEFVRFGHDAYGPAQTYQVLKKRD